MSNKFIWALVSCSLVGIAVLIAWIYWPTAKGPSPQLPKLPSSIPVNTSQSLSAVTPSSPTINQPVNTQAVHDAEIKREQSIINLLILTPITFYGKVIDDKNNPVQGAKISLSAADTFMGNNSQYERTTDEAGLFSISGIHGVGLTVSVSKEGYYILPQSYGNFGYAAGSGQSPPHTDPNDPAIFILRKMGQTEQLIVQHFHVDLAKDGTPLQFDIKTGKSYRVASGDILIEAWTEDAVGSVNQSGKFDWRCRISVPSGGLQSQAGGEFDFEAPLDGYQSQDIIDMPATAKDWKHQMSRDYFLKFNNGQYALIDISLFIGGYQFVNMSTYLNPTPGHRNLEYNPKQTASN